jgi:glutamate racemase
LHRLFDNGAKIVILACNTAAAYSVRKWQTLYPEKKVLSITIPGIEEVLAKDDIKGKV